ncbi:hypothetical protein BX661DRAFT_171029 [Kickxella alabastrina]|uniref:uncharacterized protein n=1 Tax=Kickxella alabastrina TaxID=61397 RepID=UPI00221E66E2|nr:uncharacterized protein BX661DRAFT_171029 [Kickxella alabastrina]KAI7827805.1 hypothetical protein BX661DRAFT_171029 [Kickxella alabastrina]
MFSFVSSTVSSACVAAIILSAPLASAQWGAGGSSVYYSSGSPWAGAGYGAGYGAGVGAGVGAGYGTGYNAGIAPGFGAGIAPGFVLALHLVSVLALHLVLALALHLVLAPEAVPTALASVASVLVLAASALSAELEMPAGLFPLDRAMA